nr:actin-binding, cofilin/tropomyosin type [Tanacetum cinerariifolium]
MVKSSSSSKNEVFDDSFCSISYKKNIKSLNTKITGLSEKLSDSKTIVRDLIRTRRVLDIVLFPLPAQVYSPSKKDMSWTGLPEFADDTITNYSRPSLGIESNSSDLQNSNSYVFEHGESSESIMSKPMIKFVKAADCTDVKTNKVEAAKKPFVKYAEMYRNTHKSPKVRGNQRNWNNLKTQQLGKDFVMKNKACFNCGQFDHLAYNCGLWVEKGKSWPKNNFTHKIHFPTASDEFPLPDYFPLPVMKIPLLEYFATVSAKEFPLLVYFATVSEERAQLKKEYDRRVNKRLMQTQESKLDSSKALDDSLVVAESSRTESDKHDTSSRSGNDTTHVMDANIRLVNDQEPFVEVQLTAQHNILANEQHTKQSEPIYDIYLLEKVDSNITPDSTNMCNKGGEIDQIAKKCHLKSSILASLINQPTNEQSYQSQF